MDAVSAVSLPVSNPASGTGQRRRGGRRGCDSCKIPAITKVDMPRGKPWSNGSPTICPCAPGLSITWQWTALRKRSPPPKKWSPLMKPAPGAGSPSPARSTPWEKSEGTRRSRPAKRRCRCCPTMRMSSTRGRRSCMEAARKTPSPLSIGIERSSTTPPGFWWSRETRSTTCLKKGKTRNASALASRYSKKRGKPTPAMPMLLSGRQFISLRRVVMTKPTRYTGKRFNWRRRT